jgi:hypothetical protein
MIDIKRLEEIARLRGLCRQAIAPVCSVCEFDEETTLHSVLCDKLRAAAARSNQ